MNHLFAPGVRIVMGLEIGKWRRESREDRMNLDLFGKLDWVEIALLYTALIIELFP
jgi:hypothetical protein